MRCLAAWEHMEIQVVSQFTIGNHGVLRVLLGKILKLGIELVVDHRMIFQPADFAFWSAHLDKSLALLHNFECLAVCHQANAIRHRGNTIVQINLARRYIDEFVLYGMKARAADEQECGKKQRRRCENQAQGSILSAR